MRGPFVEEFDTSPTGSICNLENEVLLVEKHRDHTLPGDYEGCRECYITPDWWLLIYQIGNGIIAFERTGTPFDLSFNVSKISRLFIGDDYRYRVFDSEGIDSHCCNFLFI